MNYAGCTTETSVILALDRNQRNLELLAQFLSREGYSVLPVSSLEEFEQIIISSQPIQLAIIDISGFDRNIWGCCEKLQKWNIPFLVISPRQSTAIQQESLSHGASSILVKPLVVREFLGIIRSLINQD
ncbi:MAG TPA: response regulator [Cyanobacteria bacterium UBA12227]|nr:response regulator [Cyanobacteria bacterium UBA12227]HAX86787.1 response regulator [Cyanobacteria bacterium UBA11370]HBY75953.1 response regulator [Cyanobacteria bacterium UBA11148]